MADRFDKFTERARRLLSLAQEEAQRFNSSYIGTEHLLLGLVREEDGLGARVLESLGIELNTVRAAVESIIGRRDRPPIGAVGLTPRAKRVIELAVEEARRMKHTHVGTEHLLIGLMRENEGIAAGLLESMGVNLERVRAESARILRQSGQQGSGLAGERVTVAPLGHPLTELAASARLGDLAVAPPAAPLVSQSAATATAPDVPAPTPVAKHGAPPVDAPSVTADPAPPPDPLPAAAVPPPHWPRRLGEAAFDVAIAVTLAMVAIALALPALGVNPPINYDEGYVLQAPVNFLREGFYGTIDSEWRWEFDPHVTTGIPVLLPPPSSSTGWGRASHSPA